MERELRERLREAAARPSGDLDVDDVRARALRVRRRRRVRTAVGALVAVAALAVPIALAGSRAVPPDVVVEPGPSTAASPRPAGPQPWTTCPGGARFHAGWLPPGFVPELVPGAGGGGSYPHPVAHYPGGAGRYVELHFGPLPSTPARTEGVTLLGQEAQLGEVEDGYVVAFDATGGRDRCGLVGLYAVGVTQGGVAGVAENLALRPPVQAPQEVAVPVRAGELVDDVAGWAATDDGLYWTLDGGGSWIDVAPDGVEPDQLRGTAFLDRVHGWSVDLPGEQGGQARVLRTSDGGNTWASSTVALPQPSVGAFGDVVIDFIDARNGWLMVGLPGGMSSEHGELFSTSDGGRTWQRLGRVPVAQGLSFASLTDGWATGGVPTSGPVELHVTRDGGRSWQQTPIPLPDGWEGARAETTSPRSWSAPRAALAVRLTDGEERAALAVFETADAGRSWQLAALTEVPPAGVSAAPPFDLTGPGSWIAASFDGSVVLTSDGADRDAGNLPNRLAALSFDDPYNPGWVLTLTGSGCGVGRDACLALLDHQNGEWVALEPGRGPQPADCTRDATARNSAPDDDPRTLELYLTCADDHVAMPPAVYRRTRIAPGDADHPEARVTAAVAAWLTGPTARERAAGYGGGIPELGPRLLRGVELSDGTATVDLGGPLRTVNNLSASRAGGEFIRQIGATVFAASASIERVVFTIDGSCEAFTTLFEAVECQPLERRSFADIFAR